MANIREYLDQIQSAIYGEEVRGSIINAITAMNSESSSAKNSATASEESARSSASSAKTSETMATNAQKDVAKFNRMTVSTQKLAAGQDPTASISDDGTKKHLTLGIPKGDIGVTPNISLTVSTGAAGSEASVTKSGTATNPTFAFTIPRGNTGSQGPIGNTPNITVKTNTGAVGSNASVSKGGTAENPVFTFTIPRGNTGAMPEITARAVNAETGTDANVSVSGTSENPILTFTIPRGNKGDKGDPGPMPKLTIGTVTTGVPGSKASATFTGTAEAPILNLTIPEGQRGVTEGVPLTDIPAKDLALSASAGTSNEVARADHEHKNPNKISDQNIGGDLIYRVYDRGESSERGSIQFGGYSGDDGAIDSKKYMALQLLGNGKARILNSLDPNNVSMEYIYTNKNKPGPNDIQALSYLEQSLTNNQKQQARTNIGAGTSNFSGSYNDLTNKPTIPTNVSQLQNDSGYLTTAPVTSVNGQTGDVTIEATEGGPSLTNSTPANLGSSASVGVSSEAARADHVHIFPAPEDITAVSFAIQTLTEDQKQQARTNIGAGTSNFSGSYNDLTNKPTIPTNVSQLQNDSGYLTTAPVTSVNGQTGDVTINAVGSGGSTEIIYDGYATITPGETVINLTKDPIGAKFLVVFFESDEESPVLINSPTEYSKKRYSLVPYSAYSDPKWAVHRPIGFLSFTITFNGASCIISDVYEFWLSTNEASPFHSTEYTTARIRRMIAVY